MIRAIDRGLKLFPTITPTLFVDDLAAEVAAPVKLAMAQMGGFIEHVAQFITQTGQKLSTTKSNVTSFNKWVGEALVARWRKSGITVQFKKKGQSVGSGSRSGRETKRWGDEESAGQFCSKDNQIQAAT